MIYVFNSHRCSCDTCLFLSLFLCISISDIGWLISKPQCGVTLNNCGFVYMIAIWTKLLTHEGFLVLHDSNVFYIKFVIFYNF